MTVPLLPDVERVLSRYLRAHADVVELVGDRVFTAFPNDAGREPLVLIRRYGGDPVLARPLVLEAPLLQVDAYGGTKRQASRVGRTVRAALAELAGTVVDDGEDAGTATAALGAFRYVPDPEFEPARPRYIADVTVTLKATGPVIPAEAPAGPSAGVRPVTVIAGG